jgi:hypothetical protein
MQRVTTVRFRRHSGHGWTCRWVAPVANDPERTWMIIVYSILKLALSNSSQLPPLGCRLRLGRVDPPSCSLPNSVLLRN